MEPPWLRKEKELRKKREAWRAKRPAWHAAITTHSNCGQVVDLMHQRAGKFEASLFGAWDSLLMHVARNQWQTASGILDELKPSSTWELTLHLPPCHCGCHKSFEVC